MSVAPDLLIGYANGVGDVKYKRARAKWLRPDLYEITAFAAAAEVARAAIIGFGDAGDPKPPTVGVGDIEVRYFAWIADQGMPPDAAAEALTADVESWLNTG